MTVSVLKLRVTINVIVRKHDDSVYTIMQFVKEVYSNQHKRVFWLNNAIPFRQPDVEDMEQSCTVEINYKSRDASLILPDKLLILPERLFYYITMQYCITHSKF